MISAGKVATDSSGEILVGDVRTHVNSMHNSAASARHIPVAGWVFIAVSLIASGLTLLPGRAKIPPQIESDYAYQLLAADRFLAGDGFTTLQPIAPGQPWELQYEWGFLTKWPVGYSMLVASVQGVLACSAIEACRVIGSLACALALVGWFMWSRRLVTNGFTGLLFAITAMSAGLTVGYLINPSTDVLLAAAIPWLLLFTHHAVTINDTNKQDAQICVNYLALAGILSGCLFWLRYASVFIPAGIGSYLIWTWIRSRRTHEIPPTTLHADENATTLSFKHIIIFSLFSAIPIAALLLVNKTFGNGESIQSQVNLGHRVGFNLSPDLIWQAWWQFTNLGYYNHHSISHWAIALWPGCLLAMVFLVPKLRQKIVVFISQPAVILSACVLTSFLAMIVLATALFGDKFDFVNLERYYIPLRPIYFLLFVAPLVAWRSRIVRLGLCLTLLVCCSWTFQQQWQRTYHRWAKADRVTSPYGAWARCFEPHSDLLYSYLRSIADERIILVSNFHEYLAMETDLPTLPIPTDRKSLDRWVIKIATSRGIENPRVLFVLDTDNHWRDYWIEDTRKIKTEFGLKPVQMPNETETTTMYFYTPDA